MVKYKVTASRWSVATKIEPLEVVKETEKTVTVINRYGFKDVAREDRMNKIADCHRIFDTWEDAHKWLTQEADRFVEDARRILEKAKGYQGTIKGMKKP